MAARAQKAAQEREDAQMSAARELEAQRYGDKLNREDWDRQIQLAELDLKRRALDKKPPNALPAGLRLGPGERYNPTTDTVEAIPGSKTYQDQANKHS